MSATDTILDRILAVKRDEVAAARKREPWAPLLRRAEQRDDRRDFAGSLRSCIAAGRSAVIAEVKKASPSKGVLREAFDPAAIGGSYAEHGAACLSVLTDEKFFQGAPAHLEAARKASGLPVLRKDFIVDAYQIAQARDWGADAILLIVAALDAVQLRDFEQVAEGLGLAVLVEVHDAVELDQALALRSPLIGINNRNLRTFEVSLQTTLDLLPRLEATRLAITESGILVADDVARMRDAGVSAFLVGEAFMRAADPGKALKALFA